MSTLYFSVRVNRIFTDDGAANKHVEGMNRASSSAPYMVVPVLVTALDGQALIGCFENHITDLLDITPAPKEAPNE